VPYHEIARARISSFSMENRAAIGAHFKPKTSTIFLTSASNLDIFHVSPLFFLQIREFNRNNRFVNTWAAHNYSILC
jgi:hypothetical protein